MTRLRVLLWSGLLLCAPPLVAQEQSLAQFFEAVEVRVLDNGHGIPAELTSRIFEPFFTTKDVGDGTGLGLEIARRIIATQHGGSIDVESEPGRTVFTVCLPLEAPRYRARDEEQVAVPSTTTR